MASLIYNSAIDDMARGAINFDTNTFKAMLDTRVTTFINAIAAAIP